MWSSNAYKAIGLLLLVLAPLAGARSALWSLSYVNEPYYFGGVFHPTLQGSAKLDHGQVFRTQMRLSLAREAYGMFEPRRDPRGWDVSWGVLAGTHIPFWLGGLETMAGVGAVLGRTQGELDYNHVWGSNWIFPERSREYRRRLYADMGIPFQVQWLFSRNQRGFGLEFSGFLSQELQRWGIGFSWQSYLSHAPAPERTSGRMPPTAEAPAPDLDGPPPPASGTEELEE